MGVSGSQARPRRVPLRLLFLFRVLLFFLGFRDFFFVKFPFFGFFLSRFFLRDRFFFVLDFLRFGLFYARFVPFLRPFDPFLAAFSRLFAVFNVFFVSSFAGFFVFFPGFFELFLVDFFGFFDERFFFLSRVSAHGERVQRKDRYKQQHQASEAIHLQCPFSPVRSAIAAPGPAGRALRRDPSLRAVSCPLR